MKQQSLGTSNLNVSNISLGCMRMNHLSVSDAQQVIQHAKEAGINFFDHADMYGGGDSERIFAEALQLEPIQREDIYLQSKTGIRDGYFDFSKEHILDSVDGSLQRLQTDYLDVLLLHRPDSLMEPEEVAEAFSTLKQSGKVRHFGVSNQHPGQIELLKKYVDQELIVNQLQFGLKHTEMIDRGFQVNMNWDGSFDREGDVLEYSRLHDMTIQAWSPFQFGHFEGVFVSHPDFPELNKKLEEIAEEKHVTKSAIAIAWILRHPAYIQAIIGSMNPIRITEIAKASHVELSRVEWYELYQAAGNQLP
ncbi:MAG TPA: aldo/keto reductase [Pseudogracilibacillus sp.]|nr:aldo/keto reductase [Pseudogracilibacillus sp.]